jgi:hypothetical protein
MDEHHHLTMSQISQMITEEDLRTPWKVPEAKVVNHLQDKKTWI